MFSFSGIDCGGKSTQVIKIREYLLENHFSPRKVRIIHSRGGYTPLLEAFKNLVHRPEERSTPSTSAQKNRSNVCQSKKKRGLLLWLSIIDIGLYYGFYFRWLELFGIIILADRYFWDSYIDFKIKYVDFDFEKWIVWKFARMVYLKPKKSVIYVIPAELSVYRSSLKNDPWAEPLELRKERIQMYMDEIGNKRWNCIIDATDGIAEVFEKTIRSLEI